jgi:4'-phosphopantetheinyl transferase
MSTLWQSTPDNHTLSPDHIDIWQTSLRLPASQVESYYNLLNDDEKSRVDSYRSDKRSNEFIITRGLLRKLLARLYKLQANSFRFCYTDKDKPYLDPTSTYHSTSFNISHSHDKAIIALGIDKIIGIDIEKIRQDVDFKKLAKRFFSETESMGLAKLTGEQLANRFFCCWSRKEAFVKALGDGLSFGLDEFSVTTSVKDTQVELVTNYDPDDSKNWGIVSINSIPGYAAAVCCRHQAYTTRLWLAE